jgi:hypothetical protein
MTHLCHSRLLVGPLCRFRSEAPYVKDDAPPRGKFQEEGNDSTETEFKPDLWVVPENPVPSPIFLVALAGPARYRRIALPEEVGAMSELDQEALVGATAVEHFRHSGGLAGPFGKIASYAFRPSPNLSWIFSVEGELVNRSAGPLRVGTYHLYIRRNPNHDLTRFVRLMQ